MSYVINPYAFTSITFSAEALAVFSKVETGSGETLTHSEKVAIARFVDSQVLDGNWSKIYALIPLRGFSQAKALVNWISGTSATLVNSPTYNIVTGFTTNASNNYINTQWTPSTGNGGSSVPLDNTAYSFNIPIYIGTSQAGCIGSNSNGQVSFTLQTTSSRVSFKHHTDNSVTYDSALWTHSANTDFYSLRRLTSTTYLMHKNAQRVRSAGSYTSEVVPNVPIFLGCWNNNGTPAFFGNGSYATFLANQESSFNYQSFYVNWRYMLMELGTVTKTVLYPYGRSVTPYTATDNLLINSEGQSNSLFAGAANGPNVAPYTHLNGVIPNSKVFWAASGTPGNTVTLEDLDYGVTNSYDSSGLSHFAAGLNMAYNLQRLFPVSPKIAYWHYGISGSYLRNDNSPNWYPTTPNGLFEKSHTNLLAPGKALLTGPIKKIIFHWNQGEADVGRSQSQYTADFYLMLKTKIDRIISQGVNLTNTEFHVITPQIWVGVSGSTNIRAAQAAFSISNFDAAYPGYGQYIDSWTIYDNDDLIHSDSLHSDFEGYYIEGIRLALYLARL